MSGDPEREAALEEYKRKLLESREWEAKLKALRLEIKGLQRDFDVSEENIKALQSVGQIIGEVLKQLDEERCKLFCPPSRHLAYRRSLTLCYSHCQSLLRTSICCRMQIKSRKGQVEARDSCGARYDYAHYYENVASRGGPPCLQHVVGGSRPGQLWRDWWLE